MNNTPTTNDDSNPDDDLESELKSLQPRQLSDGFVASLEERLAQGAKPAGRSEAARNNWIRFLAPAVAIAALTLIAVWTLKQDPINEDVENPGNQVVQQPSAQPGQALNKSSQPTLLAYSRAIDSKQLDDLLDYHASSLLPIVPDPLAQ